MDSDLAWVNGKSGRQSWCYADAFQRSIISGAIYHFLQFDDAGVYKMFWFVVNEYKDAEQMEKLMAEDQQTIVHLNNVWW